MNRYRFDETDKIYRQANNTAFNEAVFTIGGEICYSSRLPKGFMKYLNVLFEESDLTFAPVQFGTGFSFNFQKSRFWESLSSSGLDFCLTDSEKPGEADAQAPYSVSKNQSIQVLVNDINIAFLYGCLNEPDEIGTGISELKKSGAEFVVLYASEEATAERLQAIADCGADLIVLKQGDTLGSCYRIDCGDGRKVTVVSSVGKAVSYGQTCISAMFRFTLRRNKAGALDVEAVYIPCIFDPQLDKRDNFLVPTLKCYNGYYGNKETRSAAEKATELIGDEIQISAKKGAFKLNSGYTPQMSVQDICDFFKVDSSFYNGEYPIDKKVESIAIRKNDLDPNGVGFLEKSSHKAVVPIMITKEIAQKVKPVMVVAQEPVEGVPTLIVKSARNSYISLMRHIRMMYDPLTIAITGSIGKTTVTNMVKTVIGSQYRFPDVQGNYNTMRTFSQILQKLNKNYDAYIQELHGGTHGAASLGSSIVMPNIAVITCIAPVHLQQLGNSIEGVKKEKLGIIDHLQEGGYLVVNNDNEYLQNLDVPVNVVTYGAVNKDSDYYAENIVEHGGEITFTIVCKEGRYDAKIFCFGVHNVCNAVGAFAVGRLAGIEPEKIVAALSRFRTNSFRQNLIIKNGVKIFADCYNSAPDSVRAAVETMSTIPIGENGRRIAVLGDINELAERSEQEHRALGKFVASSCVDILITFGEKAMLIAEEAKANGMEAYGFTDRRKMEKKIKKTMQPGDLLLFKASHGVELDKSINNIFGIEKKAKKNMQPDDLQLHKAIHGVDLKKAIKHIFGKQ